MERAICQNGGVWDVILNNIRMGAKNGISESTTETVEAGSRKTKLNMRKLKTSGSVAGHCNCCASCSFEDAAPMAA